MGGLPEGQPGLCYYTLLPAVLHQAPTAPGAVRQRESNKLSTMVPTKRGFAQALPTLPNSFPRGCSDLPLPEPFFPRDEREKDGKWEKACGGGRGIYIYVRRQKNRLLGTKRGSKPTEANNSVLEC